MSHTPAMDAFKAFRIHSEGGKIAARFEKLTLADLDPGEVVIRATHSDINYNDAPPATRAGRSRRRYPPGGGSGLAGTRQRSEDGSLRPCPAALGTARFGGGIDNVGGDVLTWLSRTVDFWGNIASIGLTGGAELKTTVMPFILRGVALLGINSSATRREWRLAVWQRIATDLRPRHLSRIVTRTIDFDELPGAFPAYLEGKITGRTVVRIQ